MCFLLRCSLASVLVFGCPTALAVNCNVVPASVPTEADKAFLRSEYDHAATLYQEQLQQKPDDPALTVKLAQAFLKQQKVSDADSLIHKALERNPKSVVLLTMLGEVQYRQGMPWLATSTAADALKIDPCYAQLWLLVARIARLDSNYSASAHEIATAHSLDPSDPQIHRLWLGTLPAKQRLVELESYMSQQNGDDDEERRDLDHYRDYLKRVVTEPRKSCRMVSNNQNATVPFALLMHDAEHLKAFGLDVKLNDHHARLEITTGAGSIVVSRSVAERAGLKQFSRNGVSGIGSHRQRPGFIAYADDIKIGSLEFRDCEVQVTEEDNVANVDGLIGVDVFSRFLVTLDYPMRKLILGPLPQRPDDKASPKPSLQTDSQEDSADEESGETATSDTSSPAQSGPKLHDRYIAPDMKDWTKLYRIGHNILIPTSLNGSALKTFILAGAFSTTTITPDVARTVTKVNGNGGIIVKGINGKVNKGYSADEITFRFANISQKVRDVVAFDTPQVSKNLDMEVSGFIGITALGQTTMSIDYRDGLVKFSYDANRGFHITPN